MPPSHLMAKSPPIIGLVAMLTAMVLLPIGDALSKFVVATYPAEQITWIRNLVHAGLVLPLAMRGGARIPLSPLHLFRGLNFLLIFSSYDQNCIVLMKHCT